MLRDRTLTGTALCLAVAALLPGGAAVGQLYEVPAEYGMWDTWLMKDGDQYQLFFLQRKLTNIGRAVSQDLVSWTPLPDIDTRAAPGHWDSDRAKTGMCVKDGQRYVCFYGSMVKGVQRIGALISSDLKHWRKSPANPVIEIKPPHYTSKDCRDLFTYFDSEKHIWEGHFCAQTGGASPQLEPFRDKTLVVWVTLADTAQRGGSALTVQYGSRPQVFDAIVFGEKRPGVWMTGSDSARRTDRDQSDYPPEHANPEELLQIAAVYRGTQITLYRNGEQYAQYDAGSQQEFPSGTAIVMGLRHLEAGTSQPRFFAGAIEEARIYNVALDQQSIQRIVYHHTCGGPVTLGTVKLLRQRPDGSLWLAYHPAMDGLQERTLLDGLESIAVESQVGNGRWTTVGHAIEGRTTAQSFLLPLPVRAADAMITCQIHLGSDGQAGFLWRRNGNGAYAAVLDANNDSIRVVSVEFEGGKITENRLDEIVGLGLPQRPQRLRVLIRAHRSEIYCNDRWLFNVHTPDAQDAEGLGLIVCEGEARFTQLHIGEIGRLQVQSP